MRQPTIRRPRPVSPLSKNYQPPQSGQSFCLKILYVVGFLIFFIGVVYFGSAFSDAVQRASHELSVDRSFISSSLGKTPDVAKSLQSSGILLIPEESEVTTPKVGEKDFEFAITRVAASVSEIDRLSYEEINRKMSSVRQEKIRS